MSPGGGCATFEAGPSSSIVVPIICPVSSRCRVVSMHHQPHHHLQASSSPLLQQPHQQHSPSQIKEKLLQALDRDYHVVDMALALEAVSLLEKTVVTKEALETTRLGRLVNEMRKKTQNDSLARRAKDLVRRWRDMVSKPAENGTGGTGQGPGFQGALLMSHHLNKVVGVKNSASSPALSEMDRLSSSSPALLRPVHSMAAMALMSSNPSSAVTSPAFRGTVSSPAMPNRGIKSGQQQYQPSHISPSNSVASNASTSPGLSFCPSQTGLSNSSRPSTPSSAGMVIKSKAVSPGPGRPMSLFDSVAASVTNNNQLRGHKRPRDNDEDTMTGFEFASKRTGSGLNGGVSGASEWPWADECSRDSNLSWSGDSSRMTNRCGVASVAGQDDRSCSSKGSRAQRKAGAKPDSDVLKEKFASIARVSKVKTTQELLEDLARRSSSPNLLSRMDQQVAQSAQNAAALEVSKQEILAKFFQSSASASAVSAVPSAAARAQDPVAEIYSRLPPLDPSLVASLWPEEEQEVEVEEEEEEAKPPPHPVSEENVDLLHNSELDNINGTRDCLGNFQPWHETLSVASYHGDPLHLLPYVVID